MFTSVNTSVYRCKHSFERTAVAIAPAKYCGGKSGRRTPLVPLPWQLRHVCGLPVFAVLAVFVSRTPRPLPTHPPAAVAVCLASPSAATHPPARGRVGLSRVPLGRFPPTRPRPWRFVSRSLAVSVCIAPSRFARGRVGRFAFAPRGFLLRPRPSVRPSFRPPPPFGVAPSVRAAAWGGRSSGRVGGFCRPGLRGRLCPES